MCDGGEQMTSEVRLHCGEAPLPQDEASRRLGRVLENLGIALQSSSDLAAFANDVDWAATRRAVFVQSESATVARKTAAWINKVRAHAGELANLLKSPPGNADSNVESCFDFPQFEGYGILHISEFEPMLRALAEAAKKAEDFPSLGVPAMEKTIGMSPTVRFIQEIAGSYNKFTGETAGVCRVNAENQKGGKFTDFVTAVAKEWGQKPPKVESIADALRKDG